MMTIQKEVEDDAAEIAGYQRELAQARADIETVSRERDTALAQVSRLTEAIQSEANDMLATGNDRAEHTAARRRLLLSVLTPPAARQGEKEKA